MNKKDLFYVLIGALFMGSCTTTKPLTSAVQPTEVSDIQKFETFLILHSLKAEIGENWMTPFLKNPKKYLTKHFQLLIVFH
jgi:hypothetical protein